ncbi:MAG: alanine--glyoxylate aminotransferase family protein [Candidatus Aminicenantes bacterium]|nr:alanine--glyoxylate aminotransferase family protein [Candidatus Aminicenantes bacterium]
MLIKERLLTPGPTPIPEEVSATSSRPIVHHRSPEFSKIFMEVIQGLKYIYRTAQDVFVLLSSGTGAMEKALVNILCPGDKIITINAGKFGARWGQIGRSFGVEVKDIVLDWGENYTKEQLAQELKANPDTAAVFTTLSETSTGTIYDIKGYADVLSQTDAVLVVDGISGIGAMPCPMDDWNIDVLISASQKFFMTPPGLAYISFSPKAWSLVEKSTLPKYYFDAKKAKASMGKHTTPFTPGISLLMQQRTALDMIERFGLNELFQHHRILGDAVRAGVKAAGLELLSKNPGNILTAVNIPPGIDGNRFVKIMQQKYHVYISGAQEPHAGEFFRISHLGYVDGFDIVTVLCAMEMAFSELGYIIKSGTSVAAAQNILKENW